MANSPLSVVRFADSLIESGCKTLLLVTGLALLTLLSAGAFLRYVFQSGFSFATDLTELLFAIFVMAGIVQAARLGVHVATQLLLHTSIALAAHCTGCPHPWCHRHRLFLIGLVRLRERDNRS